MARGRSSRDIDFSAVGSEAFRRRNPQLFGEIPTPAQVSPAPSPNASRSILGERKEKKLNKTEERCKMRLTRYYGLQVICQPTRFFQLTGGGTYTPDFLAFDSKRPEEGILVVESKGGYRGPGAEQGHERFARAAAEYDSPLFRFVKTTWRTKTHDWQDEWWGDNDWPMHSVTPF